MFMCSSCIVFQRLNCWFLCHNSDLALRNCLLTSEMSVKIGDYGLSHSRYKVSPFIMSLFVPDSL